MPSPEPEQPPPSEHHVDPVFDDDLDFTDDDFAGEDADAGDTETTGRRKRRKIPRRRLSDILTDLAQDETRDRISIADLLTIMRGRALAALLLIFAAPNALPMIPGMSSILGLPLIYLSSQLMRGKQPWLPALVARRSFSRDDFVSMVDRAAPLLARAERLLRPRLTTLVHPHAERVIGAMCLILACVIALPIPLGNMLPAFALCLLALGLLERDGLWVIFGTVVGVASMLVVSGVVYATIKTTIYLLINVF